MSKKEIKEKAEEVKEKFRLKSPKIDFPKFMISDKSRVYCELRYYGAETMKEKEFWLKVKNEI